MRYTVSATRARGRSRSKIAAHPAPPPAANIQLLKTVSEGYAIRHWARLYAGGKHGHPPDEERILSKFQEPTWVEILIPHDLYDAVYHDFFSFTDSLPARMQARAERYAQMNTPIPPGLAYYPEFHRTDGRAAISDGNHRAYAALLRGDEGMRVYMPLSDYKRFTADHPDRVARTKRAPRHAIPPRRNPTEKFILGHATILWYPEQDHIHLSSLRVPSRYRKAGEGRRAMSAFLRHTDALQRDVVLWASPLDKATSLGKLVRFYESLGFVRTGQRANMAGDPVMRRKYRDA